MFEAGRVSPANSTALHVCTNITVNTTRRRMKQVIDAIRYQSAMAESSRANGANKSYIGDGPSTRPEHGYMSCIVACTHIMRKPICIYIYIYMYINLCTDGPLHVYGHLRPRSALAPPPSPSPQNKKHRADQ